MYGTLALTPKALEDYTSVVGDDVIDEIRRLAEPLRGLRVLHLSVTAFGTGVADLLHAAVPLFEDIGLDCHWQVVRPAEEFAAANKALYRALAGAESDWSAETAQTWLRYSSMNAGLLVDPFDVVIVHDPQPAAIRSFVPDAARRATRWVLHSHLDLSAVAPEVWDVLGSQIEPYDAIISDADAFVHPHLKARTGPIIHPAIDPLGPRNMQISAQAIQTILHRYHIDPARPLVLQLAPCDPGSDLLGAIDVHDRVRRNVPDLQLVLVAVGPPEDGASIAYFDETVRKSMEYSNVHILRGVSEVGNVEVNALQRAADVILQKGLRRGFGIWISDAQWKRRPVVAARRGGLALQVQDGETGFLADGTDEFAERIEHILHNADLAQRLGEAGHRHVEREFLITRFVADGLRLLADLTQEGR